MKRKNIVTFYLLIIIYLFGVFAGCLWQVHIKEQGEMYQYLKNGVSSYNESVKESVIAVAKDSIPELLLLMISVYIPYGIIIVAGSIAIRGFMTGFAITAAMRVFGISGGILCIGNILSVAIILPFLIFFAVFIHEKDTIPPYKLGFLTLVFLGLILMTDCIFKGILSPSIVRLWAK